MERMNLCYFLRVKNHKNDRNMNALALLYIILLSRICTCTGFQSTDPDRPNRPDKSLIDTCLFDANDVSLGNVPLLVCTAKSDTRPTSLVYGSETIWKGNDVCTSAMIYFDDSRPKVATVDVVGRDGNRSTLHLSKIDGQWVDDLRTQLKELNKLKAKAPVQENVTDGVSQRVPLLDEYQRECDQREDDEIDIHTISIDSLPFSSPDNYDRSIASYPLGGRVLQTSDQREDGSSATEGVARRSNGEFSRTRPSRNPKNGRAYERRSLDRSEDGEYSVGGRTSDRREDSDCSKANASDHREDMRLEGAHSLSTENDQEGARRTSLDGRHYAPSGAMNDHSTPEESLEVPMDAPTTPSGCTKVTRESDKEGDRRVPTDEEETVDTNSGHLKGARNCVAHAAPSGTDEEPIHEDPPEDDLLEGHRVANIPDHHSPQHPRDLPVDDDDSEDDENEDPLEEEDDGFDEIAPWLNGDQNGQPEEAMNEQKSSNRRLQPEDDHNGASRQGNGGSSGKGGAQRRSMRRMGGGRNDRVVRDREVTDEPKGGKKKVPIEAEEEVETEKVQPKRHEDKTTVVPREPKPSRPIQNVRATYNLQRGCTRVEENEKELRANCNVIWDEAPEGDNSYVTVSVKIPRELFTSPPSFHSASTDPVSSIDVTDTPIHFPLYRTFNHYYDGVPTKLLIPNDGVTLNELRIGKEEVWKGNDGDKVIYISVHLSNRSPALVYIVFYPHGIRNSSSSLLAKTESGWSKVRGYNKLLKQLIIPSTQVSFSLNLSSTRSTDNCAIFEAVLDGIPTRFYYPKLGKHVKALTHENTTVWISKSQQEDNGTGYPLRVISIRACMKKGNISLLKVALRDKDGRLDSLHLHFANNSWNEINNEAAKVVRRELKTLARTGS